jgi:hypothetical protein
MLLAAAAHSKDSLANNKQGVDPYRLDGCLEQNWNSNLAIIRDYFFFSNEMLEEHKLTNYS